MCGFDESAYRLIEKVLCEHTPKQIISVVTGKDKDGKHLDFEWFIPLFVSYTPHYESGVVVQFSDEFWQAYDYISEFVDDDFYISDLTLISEMDDFERMKAAIAKSVPNIRYVYKVYMNVKEQEPVRKVTMDDFKGIL